MNKDAALVQDTELLWVIEEIETILKLKEEEKIHIVNVLFSNFIRTFVNLERFLNSDNTNILHPVIINALRLAVSNRNVFLDAQCHDDLVISVANPKTFLHGALFVHRLVLGNDQTSAFIVQTVCLDVTEKMPIKELFKLLSIHFSIEPQLLQVFTENTLENKLSLIDAIEKDEEFIFQQWKNSLVVISNQTYCKFLRAKQCFSR